MAIYVVVRLPDVVIDDETAALGSHTSQEWLAKKVEFDFQCADCQLREGDELPNGRLMTLTRGHAHPTARGGYNRIENIIPQCMPCNAKQMTKIHRSHECQPGVTCAPLGTI